MACNSRTEYRHVDVTPTREDRITKFEKIAGIVFGVTMLALSVTITAETLLRKLFHYSLGGVDELSGYAVAICAPLTFAIALIRQSHIRINLLHVRLSMTPRAILNTIAMLSIGVLSLYLLWFTIDNVRDTYTYNSIAQTPWATPLIFPQAVWLVAMAAFAAVGLTLSIRVLVLLGRRDWQTLDRRFAPESIEDELEAELSDVAKRGSTTRPRRQT